MIDSRRVQLKQLVSAGLLGLLAVLVFALPVGAGISWCRADPIVRLGQTEYQIIVAVPEQNVPQVAGSLDFVFASPKGTSQEVLFLDSGFNGYGETVRFMTFESQAWDSSSHRMALSFKSTGQSFPIQVEVYKNGKLATVFTGTSNGIKVTLP